MRPDGATTSGLLDAAQASTSFAELAYAQLTHPSEAMAARLERARLALLQALASLTDYG